MIAGKKDLVLMIRDLSLNFYLIISQTDENRQNLKQKMKILIREGVQSDVPAIYQLVKELAIYEKEPHAVTASLADYNKDFSEGIFEAFVAETEGKIVGIALYYMTYSTWKGRMLYLEDFVVAQSHRKQGIGQLLFNAYKEEAYKRGCRIVKWQVLEWNEPAIQFYKKNEAIIEPGWYNGKIFL